MLGADGASVVVNYAHNREAALSVAADIEDRGGRAVTVCADVGQAGAADVIVGEALAKFGRLDILVNNAGVGELVPIDAITPDHVRRMLAVNVEGTIAMCVAAAKVMQAGGRIVNVSSIAARGGPKRAVYGGAKAAVESMTRSFAADLGPRGITVNCVEPGPTKTDMFDEVFSAAEVAALPGLAYLGRVGTPEDVAACVAFLASKDARHITGVVVPVNGGR